MTNGDQKSPAFISLGSNLGDRVAYLRSAVKAIQHLGDSIQLSNVYETVPMGVDDEQPDYLNMVVSIRTALKPDELLGKLLEIERMQGRVRSRPNAARTLDLDLLLMGKSVASSCALTIPHPRMHERAFVMLPMCDIAPDLVHPSIGVTMQQIANGLPDQGVRCLGPLEELPSDTGLTAAPSEPE